MQLKDTEADIFTMKTTIRALRNDAKNAKSLIESLEAKVNESDQAAGNSKVTVVFRSVSDSSLISLSVTWY